MTDLRFRDATPHDHGTFARLFLELGVDDGVADPVRFATELAPGTVFAERDGTIVGYAHYRLLPPEGYLVHLVADPSARRSGVGRGLIAETIARARAAGATFLTLSVRPDNTAAIALYESFGLAPKFVTWALQFDWSALPSGPTADVRTLEAADDARLEVRFGLVAGTLAVSRAKEGRVLLKIETDRGNGMAVFDRNFPGAYPFQATDPTHALSLVRAMRAYARPSDTFVNVVIEQRRDLADALVAAGARVRFETVRMRGPI